MVSFWNNLYSQVQKSVDSPWSSFYRILNQASPPLFSLPISTGKSEERPL